MFSIVLLSASLLSVYAQDMYTDAAAEVAPPVTPCTADAALPTIAAPLVEETALPELAPEEEEPCEEEELEGTPLPEVTALPIIEEPVPEGYAEQPIAEETASPIISSATSLGFSAAAFAVVAVMAL